MDALSQVASLYGAEALVEGDNFAAGALVLNALAQPSNVTVRAALPWEGNDSLMFEDTLLEAISLCDDSDKGGALDDISICVDLLEAVT